MIAATVMVMPFLTGRPQSFWFAPLWFPMLFGLFYQVPISLEPMVRWADGITFDAAQQLLRSPARHLLHLDGSKVHDAASLVRALDALLGAFEVPADALQRSLAHIAFESRGSGLRTIVWTDARNLADNDPATFRTFVTEWNERIEPTNWFERVLILDMPVPAAEWAQAA
ncbi:MAG: hypothetical protein H6835_17670 [Planctomycetes bacterium]|nr:hypothetical protein [Planctomycetota bacterium]